MKRILMRAVAALAVAAGLGLGLAPALAGASTHFAAGLDVPSHVTWLPQTAAGVTYTATGQFVRLPDLHWYSLDPAFVLPGYQATPIGPTPRGLDYCVGYTEYGCVWTNYTPYSGKQAIAYLTRRSYPAHIVVVSPL